MRHCHTVHRNIKEILFLIKKSVFPSSYDVTDRRKKETRHLKSDEELKNLIYPEEEKKDKKLCTKCGMTNYESINIIKDTIIFSFWISVTSNE